MKKIIAIVGLMLCTGMMFAQVDINTEDWDPVFDDDNWIDQSNFDTFKIQSERQYQDFRDRANKRFAKALAKDWSPFTLAKPIEPPKKPEPQTPPVAPKPKPGRPKVELPEKLPNPIIIPEPEKPIPQPRKIPLPEIPQQSSSITVDFYHQPIELDLPLDESFKQMRLTDMSENAISQFWSKLSQSDISISINQILAQQKKLKINDWGVYNMVKQFCQQLFPGDKNTQVAATVFLLSQMEFDVKMARTDSGLACMLSIDCQVYSTPYITNNGTIYYVFLPDDSQKDLEGTIYTYTCSFEGASLHLDMTFEDSPNFKYSNSTKEYHKEVAGYSVKMGSNENLIEFYRNYPQVSMRIYADAHVSDEFSAAIERNFRPMVQGKSKQDAVATLLNYMHYGFEYATDQDQFGYEKPFFCEENFYYPLNDCEDRSILFSRLVRQLLELDVVLLDYPNHIATAVCFPDNDVPGAYYLINGKRFVVCDPTYIGAAIGEPQPDFVNVAAEIIPLQNL